MKRRRKKKQYFYSFVLILFAFQHLFLYAQYATNSFLIVFFHFYHILMIGGFFYAFSVDEWVFFAFIKQICYKRPCLGVFQPTHTIQVLYHSNQWDFLKFSSSLLSSPLLSRSGSSTGCFLVHYCLMSWFIWNFKIIQSIWTIYWCWFESIQRRGIKKRESEKKNVRIIMMECVMWMLSNAAK